MNEKFTESDMYEDTRNARQSRVERKDCIEVVFERWLKICKFDLLISLWPCGGAISKYRATER